MTPKIKISAPGISLGDEPLGTPWGDLTGGTPGSTPESISVVEPLLHPLEAVRLARLSGRLRRRDPDFQTELRLHSPTADRSWVATLGFPRTVFSPPSERPPGLRLSLRAAGAEASDFRLAPQNPAEERAFEAFERAARASSPTWRLSAGSSWPLNLGPGPLVLFQARFHLGDNLWWIPLVSAARRLFPDREIWIVGPKVGSPWLREAGARILPYHGEDDDLVRRDILARLAALRPAIGLSAFARRPESAWLLKGLSDLGVSHLVNLEYFDPGLDPERVFSGVTHEGWFFWNALASPAMLIHALDPIRASGPDVPARVPAGETRWRASVDPASAVALKDKLRLEGPYVVMCPGGRSSDRWPVESWSRLAEHLSDRGAHVLVDGAPDEQDLIRRVVDGARAGRVVGATHPLPDFVALLAGAALLVSNDSAPIHLAQAVSTPTLYFAHLEKLVHSRPPSPVCRPLFDGCDNDLRSISVDRASAAIQEMVDDGWVQGISTS